MVEILIENYSKMNDADRKYSLIVLKEMLVGEGCDLVKKENLNKLYDLINTKFF